MISLSLHIVLSDSGNRYAWVYNYMGTTKRQAISSRKRVWESAAWRVVSVSLDDHLMLFGNQGYRFGRTRFNDTFEWLGITNTTYLSTAGRRSEEVTLPDGTSSIFVDGSDGDTLIIKGLLNVKDRKRHRNR